MNKKCPNCKLVNFLEAEVCARCQSELFEVVSENPSKSNHTILKRAIVCLAMIVFVLVGFYVSLVFSAKSLSYEEKEKVQKAIDLLEEKGFSQEAFMLNYLTVFRGSDNWLNASIEKENAYAATNFPFEIITIYPDFFAKTNDDLERAAILLHEAKHLKGADEKDAYEYVWRNRKQLGWTKEQYGNTKLWQAVRKQTKEYAPNLFSCELGEMGDCTDF
ncbi:MAG: hypothetical protein MUC29_04275 [Pyrinomonadaceae bacterium]|jgi:hypothetical protein|nr:hypothetical protein [Pyrinomonadaceae bacterium]